MTRIIAGFAGSLTLTTPGAGTRPTSDRVREAIFSALEARDTIEGARVLDLYAGSGALGLEAASRGAAAVTLVERDRAAAQACRTNTAVVLRQAPDAAPRTWDLVFLDPPYDLAEPELLQNLEALVPRLAADAVVCLERSSRSLEPAWPAGLELDRRKDYGDTTLWWAHAVS
jgi:16S rRNA (guanine966-N2)-methyltransferase